MTNKPFFLLTVLSMPFAAVVAAMRAAYEKHVPIGYEDENGFHFGPEPPSYPAPSPYLARHCARPKFIRHHSRK
jgi:hypothetical protein